MLLLRMEQYLVQREMHSRILNRVLFWALSVDRPKPETAVQCFCTLRSLA
ncbi:hypothetical protein [Oribacterium sinus]|nr:hypothetical protein [Oribacterium sinus]